MGQQWKAVGSYGTVGLEVVLSILVGLFVGQWLDAKLGTAPILTILWFFFGLAAAGRAVWRAWKEMQVAAAREEREQGNPMPLFPDEAQEKRDEEQKQKRLAEDRRWAPSTESIDATDGAQQREKEHDER